jgi:hypothetical protein
MALVGIPATVRPPGIGRNSGTAEKAATWLEKTR